LIPVIASRGDPLDSLQQIKLCQHSSLRPLCVPRA